MDYKKEYESQQITISRLNGIVNGLQEELESREIREYNFIPESITAEEQKIIGECPDDILELIHKWMKFKADHNNDLLVHSFNTNPELTAIYKTAILVYDDWGRFVKQCRKTAGE